MPTKTKKSTPVVEEEVIEDPEETITFKKSHFYSILVLLAFAVGVLVGYVAWGRNPVVAAAPAAQPGTVAQAPVTPQAPAAPVIYNIKTDGYQSLGPADAPITIVEFSDYQCPFCYRWHVQTYAALMAAYPNKIRFVYRNFPLSFHQNAFASAEAAMCAGDQNAYWKFHDVLFDNQAMLNDQAGTVLDQAAYTSLQAILAWTFPLLKHA